MTTEGPRKDHGTNLEPVVMRESSLYPPVREHRMRYRRDLGLAFAIALLYGVAASGGDQRPPFTLAVLRQDGILIPFATYDDEWKNAWPVPRIKLEIPVTLEAVPQNWWPGQRIQRHWTLWQSDGESRPLKALAPVWFRAQCLSNVGLRTDFTPKGPLAPPDAAPYPKEGLATSVAPGVEPGIEPIAVLDDSSPDWKWVLETLTVPFEKTENEAIRGRGRKHPYNIRERALRPIQLEALYRAPDAAPGGFVFYFEAVRRYEEPKPKTRPSEPPCDVLTYAWGWVRLRPGGTSSTAIFAELTDCYRWNVSFVLPLGVMRTKIGQPLWIVQSSAWQGESYFVMELVEPAKPNILWQTPGGWCQ